MRCARLGRRLLLRNWIGWLASLRGLHARDFGTVAIDQAFGHDAHVAGGDNIGAGPLGHLRGGFGVAKKLHDVGGEGRRVVGKGAEIAVYVRKSFGTEARRDDGNAGGKRFEKFHAHTGAAEDRTHEQRIMFERLAYVLDESDQVNRFGFGQGVAKGRIGADDGEAGARLFGTNFEKNRAQEPCERLLIREMTEAAEEQEREGFSIAWLEFVERCFDAGAVAVVDAVLKGGQK